MNSDNLQYDMVKLEDKDHEISLNQENAYRLASIYKVLFARLFDLFLASTPGFVLTFVFKIEPAQWALALGMLFASLLIMAVYFVLVPFLLKGNTIGKFLFKIRLVNYEHKVSMKALISREAFFLFIPWVVMLVAQITAILLMGPYNEDKPINNSIFNLAKIIVNLSYLFYTLWLLFLCLEIKLQEQQRSFVDIKFGLYVVESKPKIAKAKKEFTRILKRSEEHIALSDQPGNFDENVLKEIAVDELSEFNQSISLDKKNLLENLKVESEKKKQLETRKENFDE
ncbi:RDD family protein [Mesoplasma syrphidae]|uniref:RDD family protein n=1 Tax=Mesoplasma syrphidae TaxID=225999 RepID=A0A2K9CDT7_9MOLU|nr:RDD family protein [Mesoplasma syrphidae]AUF83814.1 RDD family protein [Mesoplasma syrphidae]